MITPGKITREEFDEALGRYPALIKSISASKTSAKEDQGQLTLEQLDKYRFEVAPTHYYKKKDLEDPKAVPAPLSHADVVQLVKWKLKHGTFRPNLLKLAESNSSDDIKKITLDAFITYKKDSFTPTKAIAKLITLRGIGPATASLLLSIHDSARVPFFSDELYQWICHDGSKASIKYNLKEYEELITSTRKLIDRLDADARDVEKVAFVLIHEANSNIITTTTNSTTPKKRGRPAGSKSSANPTAQNSSTPKEPKTDKSPKPRRTAPLPAREPTDMTAERKAQLQEIAEKARAARVAKREAKEKSKAVKGKSFRERVDAARERKREDGSGEGEMEPLVKEGGQGTKRKLTGEATTKGTTSTSKKARKSDAK